MPGKTDWASVDTWEYHVACIIASGVKVSGLVCIVALPSNPWD